MERDNTILALLLIASITLSFCAGAMIGGVAVAKSVPVEAPTPISQTGVCPVGYEPADGYEGYVWMPCQAYGDDCYSIRDDGMTNSVVLCPIACCFD